MKPICTVLLVTYNHAPYIEKSIESVLSQKTSYPYVIKIFDDASTDGSSDIIRKYAKKYPNKIKAFIADKNMGAQANIWRAYKSVDTKYCCYMETDDYWCNDNKLQMQIEALEQNPNCSFCCTNNVVHVIADKYLKEKDGKKEITEGIFKKNIITLSDIEKISAGFYGHITTRMIRSSAMQLDTLRHKESFLFDSAQFLYLMTKGNMYWIDKVCSVYVKTGKGTCSSADVGKRLNAFQRAMIDLNEDTNLKIWRKITQQLILVSDFWLTKEEERKIHLNKL